MAEFTTKSTSYFCQNVKKSVGVKSKYLVHRNSVSGKIDKEAQQSFECDQCDNCAVAEVDGMTTNYNWNKCIHPNSPTF